MELDAIKGIGPKTKQILNRIGIYQVEDFVTYYPYRYDVIKRSDIHALKQDDTIIIDGIVETVPTISFFGKNKNRMRFYLSLDGYRFDVIIFNRAYLRSKLSISTMITVIGKFDKAHNRILATDIRFEALEGIQVERMYHLTDGITKRALNQYIDIALSMPYQVTDYIPEYFQKKYQFLNKEESIIEIHHPTKKEQLNKARARMIYEELFLYMLKVNQMKKARKKTVGSAKQIDEVKFQKFLDTLPFSLTNDQRQSIFDIKKDMSSPYQMNRLIQGDVGSGKTIVGLAAIYISYLAGYQSAFMAPTEILANQHYETLQNLFCNTDIRIARLTGKMKAKEKKEVLSKLQSGEIDVIVGTHALVSDDVVYFNLGLVITDEQHRFGVRTRTGLTGKGILPDILSMSATPIPRTYALTLYGDMDVSNIKTMPSGRKPVITTICKEKEIRSVLEAMWKQLHEGHQIYVIAPLIEDSENIRNDTEKLYQNMKKAFGKYYQIGVLHGRMKATEKDQVMEAFSENKIQILISTTVVEVGVDVKNATMMVIFNAEQFGLATIHQLRGRVGRNDLQSYCILISNKKTERLDILTKTTDGFQISEEDFKMRGSGDLFGERQSGDLIFKVADLRRDFKILQLANQDSLFYLEDEQFSNKKDMDLKKIILQNQVDRG